MSLISTGPKLAKKKMIRKKFHRVLTRKKKHIWEIRKKNQKKSGNSKPPGNKSAKTFANDFFRGFLRMEDYHMNEKRARY